MSKHIDVDRGVLMRYLEGTGIQVYMYVDEPGVFLNAFGKEVSEDLAKQAGFDVERLSRERVKRERMKAAFAAIEAEIDNSEAKENVVEERDGFRLIDIGLGRYMIKDPEGASLNPVPVTEQIAKKLFDQLVPVKVEATDTEDKTSKKGKVKENGSASAS